jgi:hypothetical protein
LGGFDWLLGLAPEQPPKHPFDARMHSHVPATRQRLANAGEVRNASQDRKGVMQNSQQFAMTENRWGDHASNVIQAFSSATGPLEYLPLHPLGSPLEIAIYCCDSVPSVGRIIL